MASGISPAHTEEPLFEGGEHRDLAKGALVNTLGIAAKTIKAFYLVVVSRLFGSELLGLYLLAVASTDIAGKISGIGFDWGALRYAVRLKAQGRGGEIRGAVLRISAVAFLVSLVATLLMGLAGVTLAASFLQKDHLERPLLWLCATIPMLTVTQIMLSTLRAGRKMQYEVYVRSIAEPAVLLVFGVTAYFFLRSIDGLIIAQILSSLAAFLLTLFFFLRMYPAHPGEVKVPWKDLVWYSVPMGGMDLFNIFKQRLDLIVIGYFLPLAQVGIFGAITEIGNLIKKIRQAFEPVFMPIVTDLHERKERKKLHRHFVLAVRWVSIPSLVLFVPMLFAPDEFLRVFGADFVSGSGALMIFAAGMFVYVTLGMAENVLSMAGHPYINFLSSVCLVAVNFLLHLLLIPRYGLVGAAAATGGSFVLLSFVRVYLTHRLLGAHPFGLQLLKPLGAGAAAFAVSFILRKLLRGEHFATLFAVSPIFLVTYLASLQLLGLEKEDLEVIKGIKRRLKRF